MKPYNLRSYIAPGAPATRKPCDGSEPALRVEFGFTPRWYHQHCGVDFSLPWHLDPQLRQENLIAMRRELNRHFPLLQLGGEDPESSLATLDGVHGALFMPMLFGIPVEYYPDNWPAAQHVFMNDDQVAHLAVPVFEEQPVFNQLVEQLDFIEREYGRIEGYLNWQGVLNIAFRLRGNAVFTDPLINPELAQHLFAVITDTLIAGMRYLYARQAKTGVTVRHVTVSNCVVNMVSPAIYRDFLWPCDQRLAEAFDVIGVHNCAWNVNPYIADYATLPGLGYVDMGMDSDLINARRLCPDARRAIMYTPKDLTSKSLDELRADVERIHAELGPCDIVMADIDSETPDERVMEFARLVEPYA